MAVEPYSVLLDADTKTSLRVHLFKNVKNADEIRNNVIKGTWKCAVVKPSLIVDPFQLAVAANRAVLADKLNIMVTRIVYSEILFNLSISKNISQSLSKFGIEKDTELLVCLLDTSDSGSGEDILGQIQGDMCPITELSDFTDIKDVKQVYKLNNLKCDFNLLDLVVSRMVTKSIVTH